MVKLPPALGAFIADLFHLPRGRPTDLLHMTVLPVGNHAGMDASTCARIVTILDAIALPSFRVAFDRIGGRERTILFPSEPPRGAIAFHRALLAAFASHGVRLARPYSFRPHITLDYRHAITSDGAIDMVSWRVEDIRLIESVRGEARHVEHGRWVLAG